MRGLIWRTYFIRILKVNYEGLTGRIQLDKNGDRRNFTLDIVKVREKQLYKV